MGPPLARHLSRKTNHGKIPPIWISDFKRWMEAEVEGDIERERERRMNDCEQEWERYTINKKSLRRALSIFCRLATGTLHHITRAKPANNQVEKHPAMRLVWVRIMKTTRRNNDGTACDNDNDIARECCCAAANKRLTGDDGRHPWGRSG